MFKVGRSIQETAKLEIQSENGSKYAKIALMSNGLQKIVQCVMYYFARVCTLGWYGFKQFEPTQDQINAKVIMIEKRNQPVLQEPVPAAEPAPALAEPAPALVEPAQAPARVLTLAQVKKVNERKKSDDTKARAKAEKEKQAAVIGKQKAKQAEEKAKMEAIRAKAKQKATEGADAAKARRELLQKVSLGHPRNLYSIG